MKFSSLVRRGGIKIEGPDGAGEALPDAQGGSGALERKTRSFGYSDGGLTSGSRFLRNVTQTAMACSCVGTKILQKMWEDRSGKASGLAWTRGTVCACARRPLVDTLQGSMGRMTSSFFLPHTEGASGDFE